MKKVLILFVLLFLVTGCGKESVTNLDLKKASEEVASIYTNMEDMDKDELKAIYGLDVSLLDEYEVKSSSLSNGYFYAILKVDDKNTKEVKKQMDNLFKVLENQSDLYSPEAVKLIKNRLETSIGNYLIYIVSEDNDAMYDVIKGYVE
jgi:uncharacterized protein YceK